MEKALITGSEGAIGKELVKKLCSTHELHLWDKETGFDLAESELKDSMKRISPDTVYHLAASFERTNETPEAIYHIWKNDTLASHRLIEAIINCESIKTVVLASSYLIYNSWLYLSENKPTNESIQIKISESMPILPRNLCGMSKLYTERELDFIKAKIRPSLNIINARIFRVYGLGSKSVINRWCKMKQQGFKADIFNKENRFDFIHSRDVAEGLLRLSTCKSGIYNLGTGISRSIQEVIKLIGIDYNELPPDTEYESSCADITKLKEATGWCPSISLEDGIKELISYEESCSNHVS